MDILKLTDNIFRLNVPFMDVYTSVFAIKTDEGVLIYDTATYATDVKDYIIPFINELKIKKGDVKYVFISHLHGDHAGGLTEFCHSFPGVVVAHTGEVLGCELNGCGVICTKDSDVLLGCLRVVHIPGHTADSSGILDTRTGTLISGDSLQLYGLFGAGEWACNITLIDEHLAALKRLSELDINEIYPAHSYHPLGDALVGGDTVSKAICECKNAIYRIEELVKNNPQKTDAEIAADFSCGGALPTLGKHVVKAVRERLKNRQYAV